MTLYFDFFWCSGEIVPVTQADPILFDSDRPSGCKLPQSSLLNTTTLHALLLQSPRVSPRPSKEHQTCRKKCKTPCLLLRPATSAAAALPWPFQPLLAVHIHLSLLLPSRARLCRDLEPRDKIRGYCQRCTRSGDLATWDVGQGDFKSESALVAGEEDQGNEWREGDQFRGVDCFEEEGAGRV